jgi:hypothetical protein
MYMIKQDMISMYYPLPDCLKGINVCTVQEANKKLSCIVNAIDNEWTWFLFPLIQFWLPLKNLQNHNRV